ncbi:PAS domain S-box protein [Azohydromonas aeria]|uniref:PAS domain S-box protein n=1 Tax=Azohydromonas aeria TaxID=2590212 RepID=UPI0012FAB819|nr:PAS domain S-box protein [Azohydromonas aeria]
MRSVPPSQAVPARPRTARLRLDTVLLAMLLAVLLPALAVGAYTTWRAVRGGQAAAEARLTHTATALSLAVDRELGGYRSALSALAASRSLDGERPDLAGFELEARRVAQALGTWLVLLDAGSMRQLVNTALPAGAAPAHTGVADLQSVAATGQPQVSNLFVGPATGRPGAAVGVPVRRADRVRYVLAARLTPERLRQLLAAQALPPGGFVSVTDARDVIVARSDAAQQLVGRTAAEEVRARVAGRDAGLVQARTLHGVEHVIAFRSVPGAPGWRVFVAEPAARFARVWQAPVLALAGGGAVLLAVAAALALLAARTVLHPVQALHRHAVALAGGGAAPAPAAALPPASVRELEALRQGLERAEAASRALAELRSTLELAAVFVRDADGTILHWSRGCERLYGWTAQEAVGRGAHELLRTVFPVPVAEVEAALESAGEWRGELRHTTRDGRQLVVAAHKALRRDADGRPASVAEAVTDVTQAHIAAERVQLALDAGAIIGTWMWDLTRDAFTVDERFAETFGIDPALGRIGLSLEQVIATVHPDDLEGLRAAIAEAIGRGGAYSHEYRVRDRAGRWRWIEANGRVDLADDGSPLRFPGVLLDVGRRRELEAERDKALDLLRAFADAVPGVVYAKDREGRMLLANRGAAQAIGKPPQRFIGRTDLEYLDDAAQARALMDNDRRIMDSGVAQQFEERLDRPDGTPATWLSTKAPFRDARGEVIGIIGSSLDITERKAAEAAVAELNATLEQQVRQRTAELRAILDSAGSAIVVTDAYCRISFFNRAAEALTGHAERDALGRSATALLFDAAELAGRQQALEEGFGRRLNTMEMFMARPRGEDGAEWRVLRRDGSRVSVLLEVRTLCGADARPMGMVYALTDLTERKVLEDALRRRTSQAEAASRAKSAFLAHMSHELRTPLNAVIGLSQLLRLRELPADAARYVGHIHAAGEQLLGLVSDVLDLSRIEAGEMRLESVPFEPAALLDGVLALVRPQAEAKSLALRAEVAPALPPRLLGDPLRLRQVLLNLLSNAVKFTPAGTVTLRVQALPVAEGQVVLRLDVADTGIGIAAEQQQRIFEPFAQADDSTTRRFGGTGLGLSIVRRLVAMMNGTLAVDSEPGRGSSFSVQLPLHVA